MSHGVPVVPGTLGPWRRGGGTVNDLERSHWLGHAFERLLEYSDIFSDFSWDSFEVGQA
jgi:hypothetical protein